MPPSPPICRRGGECRPQRRRRRRQLLPPPGPSARLGGRDGTRGRKADRGSVVGGLCGPHRRRRCVGRVKLPVVLAVLALPQQQSGPGASLVSAHHAEVLTARIRVLVPVLVVVTVGEHHVKPRGTVLLHGLLLTWYPVHRQKIFTRPSLSWYASYESGQESSPAPGFLWGDSSDATGHRGATGAPHCVLGSSSTCRCGTCCDGSTWPCEAHFLCNELSRHGAAFFITLRHFWRCKAIRPRLPGKLFHTGLKKIPALMTPHRPISEPNVGPHGQKWHLCPTPSSLDFSSLDFSSRYYSR